MDTIYMGGGTPSLLGVARLECVVQELARMSKHPVPHEFTLEVTPGSADEDFLTQIQEFGVNRLSIGAQSFDARELRTVGRLHNPVDTQHLVALAREAGFSNINLDLVAGVPYQSEESWARSLRTAIGLRPEHLSVYLFEIDEKSRLGREVLSGGTRYHASAVPNEDFMVKAYESACGLLAQEGYAQYEISNFALPGYESRHNQKYWRMEPYIGLGAGAHSFDACRRWANVAEVTDYVTRLDRGDSPIAKVERLSPQAQIEEFFFLGLRERRGIDVGAARERWGADQIAFAEAQITALATDGWLECSAGRVRLTDQALLISNEIFQEFLTA